ncbi:hypothetical protein [Chamaesiphon sp. VAR_48_metabat_135_sub]|nr:hypothetical protein [Chamaesiphon sp. VAR_48_metabat_135_sub]
MKSLDRQEIKKPAAKSMKRFVIREAESIQTTRASTYGMCCCRGC